MEQKKETDEQQNEILAESILKDMISQGIINPEEDKFIEITLAPGETILFTPENEAP